MMDSKLVGVQTLRWLSSLLALHKKSLTLHHHLDTNVPALSKAVLPVLRNAWHSLLHFERPCTAGLMQVPVNPEC